MVLRCGLAKIVVKGGTVFAMGPSTINGVVTLTLRNGKALVKRGFITPGTTVVNVEGFQTNDDNHEYIGHVTVVR